MCRREGLRGATQREKDEWYREVLRDEFGVYTTKQLGRTGDFEKTCAAFEAIAGNSIYWQLRVTAAPLERARLSLKQLMREHDIEEEYVDGVSKHMFATHTSNLDADKLGKVIAALKIHFNRQEAA